MRTPDPRPPQAEADSAGVPWAGRTLIDQPFAGDDGSADPALEAALSAGPGSGRLQVVAAAWAASRALVPVVAVLGEENSPDPAAALAPAAGDKNADMALATLTGRDGTRALPAFTSAASLSRWDRAARPVPVEAARAAQAAVTENCDVVVIDPSGPVPCVLPRPVVWAVAQGREWIAPDGDPEVLAAIATALETSELHDVRGHTVEGDGAAGLRLVLRLAPGLDAARIASVTTRLTALLSADPLVAERVDGVRIVLLPASV